ncbi:MAG TPA: MFS transporter, partial [Actinomycetota bacterium]|nr:MFS transporter [Actinomycetota bacterium]
GGLLMFLFQFIVMMGVFFVLPLFLSVALGLSAIETGIRITPLSITMLLAAAGVPRFFPTASPRRVVTLGFVAVLVGIVALIGAMDPDATAAVVTVPLLVIGLGLGALASQLGAVTVSAAPEELSPEVGGLQNTASQFGASLGTALAGSILITALTASFLSLIATNPDVPAEVSNQATVELSSGIPFISDQDLETTLEGSSLDEQTTEAILEDYGQARLEGIRTALSLLAVFAVIALYFTRRIPDHPPGSAPAG